MFGPSIDDYYRSRVEQMTGEIRHETAESVLGTNLEELAEYYADKYRLPELEITEGPQLEIVEEVVDIPAHQRDEFYQDEGTLHNFPVKRAIIDTWVANFSGLGQFWEFTSSHFSPSYSLKDFHINGNRIRTVFEVKGYGFELSEDQVAQRVNSEVDKLRREIDWKNTDIRKGNESLGQAAVNELRSRKESLEKNASLVASLEKKISIPLVKRTSTEPIRPRVEVKQPVKKMRPVTEPVEQYELDPERVQDILQFIDEYMKSLERTPKSIASLGEEELRDLILAHLNGVFEGRATGETFSNKGKTDIYLNINKGNILVAECKVWGGKELLHKTVDQMRGYLTWRHNYGIVIFFCRNKNFTHARDILEQSITQGSSYISGFKQIDDTHFVARHSIADKQKSVEVHYLIYNVAA